MAKINSNILYLTSGETVKMTLQILMDNHNYVINEDDTLVFTARRAVNKAPIIEKTVVGTNVIILDSEDTKIDPGEYVFDVWLFTLDGGAYPVLGSKSIDINKKNMIVYARVAE